MHGWQWKREVGAIFYWFSQQVQGKTSSPAQLVLSFMAPARVMTELVYIQLIVAPAGEAEHSVAISPCSGAIPAGTI